MRLGAQVKQLRADFILAVRESRFLFPPEAGVFALLERLNNASFTITGRRETAKQLPPGQIIENQKQFSEALILWNESLVPLENLMSPYLNYHYISPSSAFTAESRRWWQKLVGQKMQLPKKAVDL